MRIFLCLLLGSVFSFTLAQRTVVDGIIYEEYRNSRYGYAVNYPVGYFLPGEEPDNMDGLGFASPDGRATLRVYGSHTVFYDGAVHDDISLEAHYAWLVMELPSPTYHAIYPDAGWFVISGYDGDDVYYQKHYNNSLCPSISLVLRYPVSQREKYDALVTELSTSFICIGGPDGLRSHLQQPQARQYGAFRAPPHPLKMRTQKFPCTFCNQQSETRRLPE